MDLSILIPLYNAEKYILNCLQSIVDQEMSIDRYEVIIINDGSTDTSSALVADYIQDRPNMVLIDQPNHGNAYTRNSMFDLAKGTYIYCLDADDYLVPQSLSGILEYALENQMDFVGFRSKMTSVTHGETTTSKAVDYQGPITSGKDYLTKKALPYVEVWWYIVSRKLLQDFQIRMEDLVMADVCFTYRVVLGAERMGILPHHVHWYVQSPDSIMRSKGSMREHKLRLAENTYAMLLRLNDIITNPAAYKLSIDRENMKDLVQKRDYYGFFMMLKFLRFENDANKVRKYLTVFEQNGMYPFKNQIHIHKCPGFLERLINLAVNNKKLLLYVMDMAAFFRTKK